jgi:AraC-like DNA-binding protein
MPATVPASWPALEAQEVKLAPRWHSGPRLHGSHNFYLMQQGRLRYEGLTHTVDVRPGHLLFVPRGLRHALQSGRQGCTMKLMRLRLSALGLHIDADAEAWELVMALARQVHHDGPCLSLSRTSFAVVADLLDRMSAAQSRHGPGRLTRIKALGMLCMAQIAAERVVEPHRPVGRTLGFQRIRRIIEHIEHHHAQDISVPMLARQVGLKRSRFQAVFRDYTGLSVIEYLTRVRIGEACRALRDSEADVLTIAMRCGFGSASRFYEAFHAVVGEAPGRWRRRVGR